MVDIVNLHFMGYPVLMYAMMLVTTGAITYATVYPINIKMPSISDLPSLPSASMPNMPGVSSPPGSNFSNGIPGMPPAPGPSMNAQPVSTTSPQGGKRGRKTRHHKRSPKKHATSHRGHSKKSHK